ncbi:hypothetical protein [Actinophytocola sp. NPDC049390]|uniref:hypothetical protein n=1 Tax=Actinophytocola sp. NPDC049390 TaxID=3363894 RepID=UPI0037A90AFE
MNAPVRRVDVGLARDAAETEDRGRSEQGLAAMFGYGTELVARKRAHPRPM